MKALSLGLIHGDVRANWLMKVPSTILLRPPASFSVKSWGTVKTEDFLFSEDSGFFFAEFECAIRKDGVTINGSTVPRGFGSLMAFKESSDGAKGLSKHCVFSDQLVSCDSPLDWAKPLNMLFDCGPINPGKQSSEHFWKKGGDIFWLFLNDSLYEILLKSSDNIHRVWYF